MPTPFSVEGSTPGSVVWSVDSSGDTSQIGTINAPYANIGTTNVQAPTFTGIIVENNGINSSGSVNVLIGAQTGAGGTTIITTLGAGGTQIFDTTRDYMLYTECTTTGGCTILIGPTATATLATIFVGSMLTAGTSGVQGFRVPAGWYVRFTGTSWACANPVAISC